MGPTFIAQAVVKLAGAMASHDASPGKVRRADARWRQMLLAAPTKKRGGDRYADIDKWLSRVDEREELLDLVAAYQNLKKERGLVEFGDRMVQAST